MILKTGDFADANPFGFSTKYTDPETGLVYFGYRYLDVKTAKWLSRDPLAEEGGLNLYGFAGNDSVNGYDPLGLAAKLILIDGWHMKLVVERRRTKGSGLNNQHSA